MPQAEKIILSSYQLLKHIKNKIGSLKAIEMLRQIITGELNPIEIGTNKEENDIMAELVFNSLNVCIG